MLVCFAFPVDSWSSATQQNSGVSSGEVQDQMHVPWISMAFTIAHTVILIVTMHQNDCPSHTQTACLNPSFHKFAMQPFDENPLLGPSAKTLLSLGALESDLITKSREGWRLLSAMWLHAGVLHIAGTASGMLLLGIPLERQLGFVKVAHSAPHFAPFLSPVENERLNLNRLRSCQYSNLTSSTDC